MVKLIQAMSYAMNQAMKESRAPGQACVMSSRVCEASAAENRDNLRLAVRAQDPSLVLKKDVERFIWNFLALRTSSGPAVGADGETA